MVSGVNVCYKYFDSLKFNLQTYSEKLWGNLNSYLSNHKGKGIEARVTANHHTDEETKCGYGEDDAEETQQADVRAARGGGWERQLIHWGKKYIGYFEYSSWISINLSYSLCKPQNTKQNFKYFLTTAFGHQQVKLRGVVLKLSSVVAP